MRDDLFFVAFFISFIVFSLQILKSWSAFPEHLTWEQFLYKFLTWVLLWVFVPLNICFDCFALFPWFLGQTSSKLSLLIANSRGWIAWPRGVTNYRWFAFSPKDSESQEMSRDTSSRKRKLDTETASCDEVKRMDICWSLFCLFFVGFCFVFVFVLFLFLFLLFCFCLFCLFVCLLLLLLLLFLGGGVG